MALKENGDKKKKTVIFDLDDYNKISNLANINKESGNGPDNISKIVRESVKQYLNNNDELDILKRYTKKELINYFTLEEATLIIAALNGMLYDISTINPKIVLIGNIEDSIELEGFDCLYKVNKKTFLKKLNMLSEFQSYLIISFATEFWNLPTNKRQNENMTRSIKEIFLIR